MADSELGPDDENVRWLYFLSGWNNDWVFSTELRGFGDSLTSISSDSDATVCWAKTKIGCNVWGQQWSPEDMMGGVVGGAAQQWIVFTGKGNKCGDDIDNSGTGSGDDGNWSEAALTIELMPVME